MKSCASALFASLILFSSVTAQEGRPTVAEEVQAVDLLPAPNLGQSSNASQDAVSILEESGGARVVPPTPTPANVNSPEQPPLNEVSPRLGQVANQPYEVLLRGPLHEAFAIGEIVKAPAQSIKASPPPNVFEIMPSGKPRGNDVHWVPGYWMYFEDAGDFAWVSGFYRDVPPGRKWVEGYWLETEGGYARVSGYWGSSQGSEAVLPEPPGNKTKTPNSNPPSSDTFWMPGEWQYVDNQYKWKEGFWTKFHNEWVWQSTYFIDTTEGYIRVPGYWDYQPKFRGVPFAPVLFSYIPNNFEFAPSVSIGAPLDLMMHLFARMNTRELFYGDYYSSGASLAGYLPWYQRSSEPFASANLLSYFEWKYRNQGISYADKLNQYASHFRSNPGERPGQTLGNANGTSVVLSPSRFGKSWDSIVQTSPTVRVNQPETKSTESLLAEQQRRQSQVAEEYRAQMQTQQARQSGQVLDAYGRPIPSNGLSTNPSSSATRGIQPQPMAQSRLPTVSERTQASRYGGTPNTAVTPQIQQPTTLRDRIRSRIIAGPAAVVPTINGRIIAPPTLVPPIMPPTLVPGFVPPSISPRMPVPGVRFRRR